MKKAGRISFVLLLTILAVVVGLGALFFVTGQESPETVGTEFLSDLAKGDVDGLTKLSYMDNTSPDEVRKKWQYAVNAGKYYFFKFQVTGLSMADPETAALRVDITKNSNTKGSYADHFEIPLLKKNGHWLVDVRSMDHSFYPAVPR